MAISAKEAAWIAMSIALVLFEPSSSQLINGLAQRETIYENHIYEHTFVPTTSPPTISPSLLTDFVVMPLEVKREKLATGYLFTVRYVPHAQNLRFVYINDTVGRVLKVKFETEFQVITTSGSNPHLVYFMTETER
ncbi:hypothetical protein PoB_005688900 [Plakobranchus ocellatus]|uniref:Uncharacterized protein n=1 Tax=Plakobranchus ocellatus TaxID=259542 RepID=A0AAV4CGT0_9GAST|nr:hypothetical protein PoB_005688900 [Plakobranchus ocellatus]